MRITHDDSEENVANNAGGNGDLRRLGDAVRTLPRELWTDHSLRALDKRDTSTEPYLIDPTDELNI